MFRKATTENNVPLCSHKLQCVPASVVTKGALLVQSNKDLCGSDRVTRRYAALQGFSLSCFFLAVTAATYL